MKFEVTLKDLRQAGACYSGYNKLVRSIQGKPFTGEDDKRKSYIHHAHKEPVPIISILETNGLDDALWALRCVPEVDWDAARDAAREAAGAAARAAARSAPTEAAWDTAWDAAWDAARASQEEMFRRMCQGKAEWQTVKALVTH